MTEDIHESGTDDESIELHTSAPRVELERDNARKKRCEGCKFRKNYPVCWLEDFEHPEYLPVCTQLHKYCVDIPDESCPKHMTGKAL